MAAPSGTSWGAISGSSNRQGRIGLYISLSNTNTTTNVTIEVWFWSRVSVDDSNNSFYFDNEKSSATTSRGSVSVRTTSNNSWNTANQVKIKTYTYSYARGTSASTKTCAAKLTGIEWATGTMTVSKSYTIPALASYKITYNANGGSGAPGQQTKYYGKNLTLSSTKPSRTGYTFQGWATSSTGGVTYASGATYSANSAVTLYAVWKANTWTVKYDANGGSGAPGDQTKTYGQTLTLSSTKPTRTNYNFLGWGTSAASTTVAYAPGADYTGNSAITLYAIWSLAYVKPIIEITSLDRCTSSGTYTDDGTYAKIIFNWSTEYSVSSMKVEYKLSTSSSWISGGSISASGTSGTSQKIFGGSLDSESQYNVKITVADSNGSSIAIKTLGAMTFEIDFLSGGKGVAIGKPATNKGFEVAYDTVFEKNISFSINSVLSIPDIGTDLLGFNNSVPGVYRPTILDDIALDNGKWLQGKLTNGYFTNILRMNASNQVELNWTSGGLKGRVFKKLWEGTLTNGGTITVPESQYYNVFLVETEGSNDTGVMARTIDGGITGLIPAITSGLELWINLVRFKVNGTSWNMQVSQSISLKTGNTGTVKIGRIIGLL